MSPRGEKKKKSSKSSAAPEEGDKVTEKPVESSPAGDGSGSGSAGAERPTAEAGGNKTPTPKDVVAAGSKTAQSRKARKARVKETERLAREELDRTDAALLAAQRVRDAAHEALRDARDGGDQDGDDEQSNGEDRFADAEAA